MSASPHVEIVVSSEARSDASLQTMTHAMVEAASEALSTSAQVRTVDQSTTAADVVVTIRWSGVARRHAVLHVHVRDGREAERDVALSPSDPDQECGRALGFVIAAMIPEDVPGRDPPAPAERPRAPVEDHHDRRVAEDPPRPFASRLWVDATGQAATGFGGDATSGGGALAIRVPILRRVALRAGGAVRFGELPRASATGTVFRGDVGGGMFSVVLDPRLQVGARVVLVVLHHALRRTEADGSSRSGAHTLLGAELAGEASFALAPHLGLVAAVGTEVAFGPTRVRVGADSVATIPVVRGVAELGVRFAF